MSFDPMEHPNCSLGHRYALDVVDGTIPASIYTIGACKRYLKDLEEKKYPFDADLAEKFLRLVQKFDHVKGRWPTKNIVLEPWQLFLFMNVMGFKNPVTNERRYRVAHIEIPRGSGKSCVASLLVLYLLAMENPKGNEISCAATKVDQARIVLDSARVMAKNCPGYLKNFGVKVLSHKIVHPDSNSFARALSSDNKSLDGLNDILCVIDELHVVTRPMFDVLSSGLSKRNDSLLFCITTAGDDLEGVGHSQSQYAKKVALGEFEDDQFFSLVYTVDEKDDIFSEKAWKKANPNYGISVDKITLEAKAKKAKNVPSDLANFKTKHLNIWISEAKQFFDTDKWNSCAKLGLRINDFEGKRVRIGIDLASHIDLASVAFVFNENGKYQLFERSYIPEATVKKVRNAMYDNAIGRGELIRTPGEAINFEAIRQDILAASKLYRIIDAMYDPWAAIEFAQELERRRIQTVKFGMNVANFSEPMKRLDSMIREGLVEHSGSGLLKWCVGNVVAKEDHNGNVFPRKSDEKLKIDPVIAILMALGGWLQEDKKPKADLSKGLRII